MAQPDTTQTFTLLASDDRVLARNSDGKLIDIGALVRHGEDYAYRLDTDGIAGEGFRDPRETLADVARNVTFLYLDGLFTSLPDVAARTGESWRSWPSIDVRLDAADVDAERIGRTGGQTPHIF